MHCRVHTEHCKLHTAYYTLLTTHYTFYHGLAIYREVTFVNVNVNVNVAENIE